MGDVATHIVSLLLMPWFTHYLDPFDYGIWGLLLTASLVAKILFRWGVDASFMRFFYDCEDDAARQRLASTILFFLLAANGVILVVALAAAPFYSTWFFKVPGQTLPLQLMIVSTFIGGFFFLPFHVFRIRNQPKLFSALTFARSALDGREPGAARPRLSLRRDGAGGVGTRHHVRLRGHPAPVVRAADPAGLLAGDAARGAQVRSPPRAAWTGPAGRGPDHRFLPDPIAVARPGQAVTEAIGLYQVAAGLGLALKFFLSAFEYAWAPFYFQTMKEKDAQRTFATIATYGLAVLVLLSAGLSAVARDVDAPDDGPEVSRGMDGDPVRSRSP